MSLQGNARTSYAHMHPVLLFKPKFRLIDDSLNLYIMTLVKGFRIIPKSRILRLTSQRRLDSKYRIRLIKQ